MDDDADETLRPTFPQAKSSIHQTNPCSRDFQIRRERNFSNSDEQIERVSVEEER